ncbi:MAG: thioredoxin family protein [Pseudomonadota bacterium]
MTESTMIALGSTLPGFSLPDSRTGETVTLEDVRGARGTLVMFICNHCPFVKHLLPELARLGRDYADSKLGLVAISSNDVVSHPADHPDRMAELAAELDLAYPYLFDESQDVARAFEAACTPDFFLLDADDACVYRGQFDDSRPGNGKPVDGADLRLAMQCLLNDRPMPPVQKPSVGCNIKWRS